MGKNRRQSESRGPVSSAVLAICFTVMGLAVLWQLGHAFVMDDIVSGGETRPDTMFVTSSDVNLRSGPGIDREVLTVVPVSTDVMVTGEARNGFAPVRVDGLDAWISTEFLLPEGSTLAVSHNVDVMSLAEPSAESVSFPVVEHREPNRDAAAPQTLADVVDAPVVMDQDPASEPKTVPAGESWIEIDRVHKTVTLHQGDTIVGTYDALIGKDPSEDGYYATAVGTFQVFMKNRELAETPFAPGVYLTDFVGFDPDRSNGIHSPVRDAAGDVVVTGGTTTLGCVRLSEEDARTVFDFAEIGMRVEVHD